MRQYQWPWLFIVGTFLFALRAVRPKRPTGRNKYGLDACSNYGAGGIPADGAAGVVAR
jgi:hypothetical protein